MAEEMESMATEAPAAFPSTAEGLSAALWPRRIGRADAGLAGAGAAVRSALRVGIEAADALSGHRAIGRYARELPRALLRVASRGELDLRLLLFGLGCHERSRPLRAALGEAGAGRIRAIGLPGKFFHLFWNRFPFPAIENFLGPLDVVHALSFLTPPARRAARTILTMHGIVNFVRPDLLDPRLIADLAPRWDFYLRRADWIVSVSETARRDFLKRFDFPAERIRAIPLGVSAEFRPLDPDVIERKLAERFGHLGIRRPYILFVGGMERVKNVRTLLEAYALVVERRKIPHRLVLAGPPGNGSEEVHEGLKRPGIGERVKFAGCIGQTGGDLSVLYGGADLLVQPSLYEGWASPPLEAMACGTPVVASNAASLPETCGDGALYADPLDAEALAAAIEHALTEESVRAELIRRGRAWSARWSWERTAEATLNLYRDAASEAPRRGPRRVRVTVRPPARESDVPVVCPA